MGGCLSKSGSENSADSVDKIQVINLGDADRPGPAPKQQTGANGTGASDQKAGPSSTGAAGATNGSAAGTNGTSTAAVNVSAPPTSKPVIPSGPYKGGVGSNGKRNATLVILGLNNAGKTTIGNHIKGSPGDFVYPTMGFDLDEDIISNNFNVKIFGLGGADNIRGYWANYYDDIHGIIFVIDSADTTRLPLVKQVFAGMAADSRVAGKPLLLFANKQDLPGALSCDEIGKALALSDLHTSPYHFTKCVALVEPDKEDESEADKAKRKPPDPEIPRGLAWLLSTIDGDFRNLNERVERDLAARKIANAKQAEEKRRQVEAWRKEEEEKERRAAEQKESADTAAANATNTNGTTTNSAQAAAAAIVTDASPAANGANGSTAQPAAAAASAGSGNGVGAAQQLPNAVDSSPAQSI